jgi:hypothetical protein
VDNEIVGPRDYFNSIYQDLDTFKPEKYRYYFKHLTYLEQSALVKQWSNNNSKLQFWVTNSQSEFEDLGNHTLAIIYETLNNYLIIGNYSYHPNI